MLRRVVVVVVELEPADWSQQQSDHGGVQQSIHGPIEPRAMSPPYGDPTLEEADGSGTTPRQTHTVNDDEVCDDVGGTDEANWIFGGLPPGETRYTRGTPHACMHTSHRGPTRWWLGRHRKPGPGSGRLATMVMMMLMMVISDVLGRPGGERTPPDFSLSRGLHIFCPGEDRQFEILAIFLVFRTF